MFLFQLLTQQSYEYIYTIELYTADYNTAYWRMACLSHLLQKLEF